MLPECSGRSRLALALAHHVSADPSILAKPILIRCAQLAAGNASQKPPDVRAALESRILEAVSCAPSLVVLDDLDSIAGAHEGPEAGDAAEGARALAECLGDIMDACRGGSISCRGRAQDLVVDILTA